MSSEKMPSKRHDLMTFNKFDFTINYGVVTEYHRKYERSFKDQDGLRLTLQDLEKMTEATNQQLSILWEPIDEICETRYVEYAERVDPTVADGAACRIEVWSTAESPILGTVNPTDSFGDYRQLIDPCVVVYDGKSRINLLPVFNVARTLLLRKDAIKTIMSPSEILLALYPGFILQNRQAVYQLKPNMPLEISPVLTNDAEGRNTH